MQTIRSMYRKAAEDTRYQTREYWTNVAFLSGFQWIYTDPVTGDLDDLPEDDRIRLVINRMAPNHRTILSTATSREMRFEVRPNGADDATLEAAYAAEEIITIVHEEHHWERLREKVTDYLLKGGTAALALDWDPVREDTVDTPLSIADFVVEPGARDAESARWWIRAQVLPPAEVKAMFGLDTMPDADATAGMNPLTNQLLAVHRGDDGGNDLTLVLTYYERPNPDNEEGQFIVEVNQKAVQKGKWPFPFKDTLNLTVGTETLLDNRWFGQTIYSQARGPQVALNQAKSNITEHLRDASFAQLLVPHSAIRLLETRDDVPGNMLPYMDEASKPSWLSPAQLPAWLMGLPSDYMMDIDDIMGVHDVSRGRAPANLESGTAISILTENDSTPTGRLVKTVSHMFTRHARLTLQTMEKYAKKARTAVIETQAGPLSVEWTGKDIMGQYRAFMPMEAIMPRSKAAMQQFANTMVQMGMVQDLPTYAKVTEMPDAHQVVEVAMPDVARAQREHAQMAKGETVLPATYDDHTIHIHEHNNFRKSRAYERMSAEDRAKVDLHIQGHETMAAEAMAKMASRAAADPALAAVPSADGDPAAPVAPPAPEMPGPEPAPEEAGAPPDMQGMIDDLMAGM